MDASSEPASALGFFAGIELAEQLPGCGALQAPVEHQASHAHGVPRDHVDAKHLPEMRMQPFGSGSAQEQMMLRRQAGHDRGHDVQVRFVRDGNVSANSS